jgi:transcriptional regulator with XRE-family HTH domain
VTNQDDKFRGIHITNKSGKRAPNREYWVNEPLQNTIVKALDARNWTISDLGRAIGSQPSLISRWMMGARPNPDRTIAVANALGLDVVHLMVLAGHLPPSAREDLDDRTAMLLNKMKEVEMTDERFAMLNSLLETMRKTAPQQASAPRPRNGNQVPQSSPAHRSRESA